MLFGIDTTKEEDVRKIMFFGYLRDCGNVVELTKRTMKSGLLR